MKMSKNHFSMSLEENRLATFKKWIFDDDSKCSAFRMAEAGFYFVGNKKEPDSVMCFLCLKSLDGWEPQDDPWQEHCKHAAKCKFAQLQKSESELTFMEYCEILKEQFKNYYGKDIDEFKSQSEEFEQLLEEKFENLLNKF